MLWAKTRNGRASRFLSMLLTAMLVSTLVSPSVAVFADETTATPVPAVPAIETPVTVPGDPVDPVVTDPVPTDVTPVTPVIGEATQPVTEEPVLPPQTTTPAAPDSTSKSVEVATVVAAAILPLVSSNNETGPRSDFPDPIVIGEGCDLTTIATFWAGQNYEAGTVSANNDAENLYVTFTTTGGWTMSLTHLYVGLVPPASYSPGSFPYQTAHAPAVTSFTYTIPLSEIGAVPGDTVYIAAHAEVSNGTQSETAWAGTGQWPGLLFAHVIQECVDEPNPADLTVIKFNDLNGNGEKDEGEPVISGIDFTATMGETVLTETTDANGTVVFVDLADGTYTVSETLPEGWVATTEIPFDISVVAGQDATVYVGNQEIIVPPDPADLTVIKFNDLNGNGVMDEGEPVISGIDFTATMGETVLTETTDANGTVVFVDLADGTYTVSETLPEGWVATTEIPFDISVVAGQDATVYVGNQEIEQPGDVTKTFRLIYPSAPAGVTFYAGYTDGETSLMVELLGEGPFEAEVVFPHGTEITVSWYALYGSELILLGSGEPEVLTMDIVNVFEYSASASGYKFNDLDANGVWDEGESGMGGWLISLYREAPAAELAPLAVPAGFELYATTTTLADGSYSFSGLLPGTYYVAEEDRAGWFMTVGPEDTFALADGIAVGGLTFGNSEEPVLPFTSPDLAIAKVADVENADPGELITYTLTYRNVGDASAEDFRIVDDYDERYVAVVDSNGGTVINGTIVWELAGPLSAADGPMTLTYTVRVLADVPEGTTAVENVVVISHPDDENLSNNTADEIVTVDNPALPFTPEPEEEEFLPFTGSEVLLVGLLIAWFATFGAVLRLEAARRS